MRKADAVLVSLSGATGALMIVGALKLYDSTPPDERGGFWVRVALGIAFAVAAVATIATSHWIMGAFASLLSAITPLAEGWAWVAIGAVVVAIWALARAWNELTYERKPSQISE